MIHTECSLRPAMLKKSIAAEGRRRDPVHDGPFTLAHWCCLARSDNTFQPVRGGGSHNSCRDIRTVNDISNRTFEFGPLGPHSMLVLDTSFVMGDIYRLSSEL